MTPEGFLHRILTPGLEVMASVCGVRVSAAATRWLLAVALQKSALEARYQRIGSAILAGPARGWWQFDQGGGVKGVLRHPTSAARAGKLCDWYAVEREPHAVWRALEGHDGLATGFARLLLLTDPRPIPDTVDTAWICYLRLWRPGKPHPNAWPAHWRAACEATA